MTTIARDDLFTHIHKAIRHGLFQVTELLGTTDWTDPVATAAALEAWQQLEAQLRSHARHEDEFSFPLLESKRPDATAAFRHDHTTLLHEEIATGEAIRCAATSGDPQLGLAAFRTMSRFCGHYLEHLVEEEQQVMSGIWETCTDGEIHACELQFLATVSPDVSAVTTRWILESIDPAAQLHLVRMAREIMPPELFAGLWHLAASVLAPAELDRLEAALHA